MAVSTKSYFSVDTNDTSSNYAKAASDNSYKYYNNMSWSMWGAWYPATNKNVWSLWDTLSGAKRSWLFTVQSDGTLRIILSWDGTSFSLHKTTNAIFDGSWKNIIIDFASGTFHCYVNGVLQTLVETIPWGGGAVALNAGNVAHMIGSEEASAPVADKTAPGCYSNFSLWNKVLSAGDRTAVYNSGRPGTLTGHASAANLTNWVKMDQTDSGATLVDSIASGANLTIVKSGTTQFFNQSNNYATVSSDPGIASVKTGTAYIIDGTDFTGTYTGSDRWSDPGTSHVESGISYKANSLTNNKTGTLVGGKGHIGPGLIG